VKRRSNRVRSGRGARAFTLAELLVVIGIIVLLCCLLLPAIAGLRQRANQAKCASNLRQCALAFEMYVEGSKGRPPGIAWMYYPSKDDWVFWEEPPYSDRNIDDSKLAAYLGVRGSVLRNVFRCPSDLLIHDTGVLDDGPTSGYPLTYRINAGLRYVGTMSQIRHPAEKVLFYEGDDHSVDGGFWWQPVPAEKRDPDIRAQDNLTDRHGGKGQVAFVDGHVEAVLPSFAHEAKFNALGF
jgi:prepilin-type processing-associated H-X9-DG protein